MAELPVLPVDSAAAIERAREAVISTRIERFPVLFERPFSVMDIIAGKIDNPLINPNPRPPKIMPATLTVELRDYTAALFDAEASTIIQHAQGELLRSWLSAVGSRIQTEVTQLTTDRSQVHDKHCPLHERIKIISTALFDRTEHWTAEAARNLRDAEVQAQVKAGRELAKDMLKTFPEPEPLSDRVRALEAEVQRMKC